MLTENEREWLERRERHEYPFCISCGAVQTAVDGTGYCYPIENCPLEARIEDWQDATEFDANVAKRLAFMAVNRNEESPCNKREPCDPVNCYSCWLKTARLSVEEEMENEK